MRKLKIGLLLFAISMLLITCKKEHIEPSVVNGTPVFYFNGTVNGSPVSLDAGVSSYYMYSSYSQSPGGLYSFIGNLQQVSSSKSSIEFIINDYRILSSGAQETNIATSLDTGSYSYYLTNNYQYVIHFTPTLGTVAPASYVYNFGDGNTLAGSGTPISPYHTYYHLGKYNTSLFVKFADGDTASISNQLNLNSNNVSSLFSDSIIQSISLDTLGRAIINYNPRVFNGSGTFTYHWSFNDPTAPSTDTSASANPTYTFGDTVGMVISAVKITEASDTIITNINSGNSKYARAHLVNYSIIPHTVVPNTEGLSTITIIYTDASGNSYTSVDSTLASGSNFQIVSVSNYQNNENNQTTKMLHVKFNCTLYNGSNSITIKNGDAVIAVAYK
jgi:hypothetical protein